VVALVVMFENGSPGASLNKGSLTGTTSTLFDRTLDVYGVKLLVGGASGTQDAVPDAWAYKVAQSYVMLMDPTVLILMFCTGDHEENTIWSRGHLA